MIVHFKFGRPSKNRFLDHQFISQNAVIRIFRDFLSPNVVAMPKSCSRHQIRIISEFSAGGRVVGEYIWLVWRHAFLSRRFPRNVHLVRREFGFGLHSSIDN